MDASRGSMRTKKRIDYGELARRSVKKDFETFRHPDDDKTGNDTREIRINTEKRIISISDASSYYVYSRFIIGKLIRVKEKATIGSNSYYCEFVHEEDRKSLNMAAGWSDRKKLYLFDGIKFK